MTTPNQINPMAVIQPMAEGLIALMMMSTMATTMSAMTVTSAVGALAAGGSGSFGAFAGFSNPYEELESVEKRISSLSFKLGQQRFSVRGTRDHKAKLMKEYGLGVLPPIVQLNKYPKLKATDRMLTIAEKDLDRMELRMMLLQKKRKELQVQLKMKMEAQPPRRVYPAMKKFKPPPGMEY